VIACHRRRCQILKRHARGFENGAGTIIAPAGMGILTQFR